MLFANRGALRVWRRIKRKTKQLERVRDELNLYKDDKGKFIGNKPLKDKARDLIIEITSLQTEFEMKHMRKD